MGASTGDRNAGDGERPQHAVSLPSFSIDATAVTNKDFERFVDVTAAKLGYRARYRAEWPAVPGSGVV